MRSIPARALSAVASLVVAEDPLDGAVDLRDHDIPERRGDDRGHRRGHDQEEPDVLGGGLPSFTTHGAMLAARRAGTPGAPGPILGAWAGPYS